MQDWSICASERGCESAAQDKRKLLQMDDAIVLTYAIDTKSLGVGQNAGRGYFVGQIDLFSMFTSSLPIFNSLIQYVVGQTDPSCCESV